MGEYVTISVNELTQICERRFIANGVPKEEAEIISGSLVDADRRGVFSHGSVCVPRYIKLIREGFMLPKECHTVIRGGETVEVWDGMRSSGQVLGHRAMLRAAEKARGNGVGITAVRHANHFGAGAYYAMLAMRQGLIGIAMCTGSPTMAPWGGANVLIGNNPIAIAVPAREHAPVVLDMAQSVVAFGRVANLKKQGETSAPPGWVFDINGEETTSLQDAYSVIPIAGHKGYGMAVMVDILSGVLFGGATGPRADDRQEGPGMLFIALDIGAFGDSDTFYADLDRRIEELKSARLARGSLKIYMPGEIEEDRAALSKEKIYIMKEILDDLTALSE